MVLARDGGKTMGLTSTCDTCGAPVPVVTAILLAPQVSPADHDHGNAQGPEAEDQPLLHTIPEAARKLRIGKTQLYALLRAGEIPRVRLGRNTTRIAIADLEAFVARNRR
jgi:excisionase family DNA binding protein